MKYYLPLAALVFTSVLVLPSPTFADSVDTQQLATLTAEVSAGAAASPVTITNSASTSPSSALSTTDLTAAAASRESLMLQAAQTDLHSFLSNVIPAATRAQLPASVQSDVEQEVTVNGTLVQVVIDDFSTGTDSNEFHIVTSNGQVYTYYPLYPDITPASNTQVSVTGYELGTTLVQDPASVTEPIQPASNDPIIPTSNTTGTQHVLIIPIKFSITSDTLPTPAVINNRFFNGPFSDFYSTQSSGKLTFVGKTLPWVTVTSASAGCESITVNTPEIQQAIENASVNLGSYRNVIFMFDANDWGGGCSIVGPSGVTFDGHNYLLGQSWFGVQPNFAQNDSYYPFPWNTSLGVAAHEVGHTLGLVHANGWDCRTALTKQCSHVEYGNEYDIMGFTGGFAEGFNAYYRQQLGWAATSTTLNINQSGTYSLNAFEGSTGNVFATIQNPALTTLGSDDTPYYLEFRQPIGYDQIYKLYTSQVKYTGALINKIIPVVPTTFTRLIDASPTKNATWQTDIANAGVAPKVTVDDPSNGIKIQGVSTTNATNAASSTTTFTVTLSAPTCTAGAPSTTPAYYFGPTSLQQGVTSNISLEVYDASSDGCGKTSLQLKAQLPAGFSFVPNSGSVGSVIPEGAVSLTGGIAVASSTPAGTYSYTLLVTDQTTGIKAKLPMTITVTEPLLLTKISPKKGPAGTTVKVFGTGFSPTNNQFSLTTHDGSAYKIYSDVPSKPSGDGEVITFQFPTQLTSISTGKQVDTPPGDYPIYIYNADSHQDSPNYELFTVTEAASSSPADMLDASTTAAVATTTNATSTDPVIAPPIAPMPIVTPPGNTSSTTDPVAPPNDGKEKKHKNK